VLHSAVITPRLSLRLSTTLSAESIDWSKYQRQWHVYRTVPHGQGARKQEEELDRGAAFLSFFFFRFTVVLPFRTYVCRGSYVPSSASKRADLLLGLSPIYRRRDRIIGITRFTTTDRRDASRDTLSEREAPHAHGAREEARERERERERDRERKREREIQRKAVWTTTQLRMLRTGCVALAAAVAVWPLRWWLRMTLHCADGATLNHREGSVGKRATHRF